MLLLIFNENGKAVDSGKSAVERKAVATWPCNTTDLLDNVSVFLNKFCLLVLMKMVTYVIMMVCVCVCDTFLVKRMSQAQMFGVMSYLICMQRSKCEKVDTQYLRNASLE